MGAVHACSLCVPTFRRAGQQLTAGITIYQTGTGPFAAIFVGFMTGGLTLVLGRTAASVERAPIVRLLIGLLFALPAARAGYDVTLALAHIGTSSEWWRKSFAMLGAITVGSTAWARLSMQTGPVPRGDATLGPAASPIQGRSRRVGDSTGPSSPGWGLALVSDGHHDRVIAVSLHTSIEPSTLLGGL